MNIGESSSVALVLRFLRGWQEGGPEMPDPVKVALAMQDLRDRAGRSLQMSGAHIISDSDIESTIESVAMVLWDFDEEADGYGANIPTIENIDTHGRT